VAGEIVIPCKLWIHRVTNPLATYTHLANAGAHTPDGILLPNAGAANVNGRLTTPVPADINATPAGKLKLRWATASADVSGTARFSIAVFDLTVNTTSTASAADETLVVTDASNGQYVENECEVSLSATTQTAGKDIRFCIARDPAHGSDTLAADIVLMDVLYVADVA
jgi:hypothetical protein